MELATRILGTDAVDLIVLQDVPSLLAHRALRGGRLLLDSDPRQRTAVVEDVLRRYLDEEPLRAELERGLRARIREGRFADWPTPRSPPPGAPLRELRKRGALRRSRGGLAERGRLAGSVIAR